MLKGYTCNICSPLCCGRDKKENKAAGQWMIVLHKTSSKNSHQLNSFILVLNEKSKSFPSSLQLCSRVRKFPGIYLTYLHSTVFQVKSFCGFMPKCDKCQVCILEKPQETFPKSKTVVKYRHAVVMEHLLQRAVPGWQTNQVLRHIEKEAVCAENSAGQKTCDLSFLCSWSLFSTARDNINDPDLEWL